MTDRAGAARESVLAFLGTVARPGRDPGGVSDDGDLVAAGVVDSLVVIQIILYLEQEYGVDVRSSGIDPASLTTIGGILETIERAS